MVKPRLIHGYRVEIAILPTIGEEQDDVWHTPLRDNDEIFDDPATKRVIVKAQVKFSGFEELVPTATGSNEDTDGYLIITEADQEKNNFKVNDHVIRLLGSRIRCVRFRITEVRPVAQRATFGLYRLDFKDDSKGRA